MAEVPQPNYTLSQEDPHFTLLNSLPKIYKMEKEQRNAKKHLT